MKNKRITNVIFSLALSIMLMFSAFGLNVPVFKNKIQASTSLTGSGVEGDPYLISTAAQLNAQETRDLFSEKGNHFKLTADIDLIDYTSGEGWMPIPLLGEGCVLDGNGKSIRNLKINVDASTREWYEKDFGLFAFITGSEDDQHPTIVKDLNIVEPDIFVLNGSCVGTIFGTTPYDGSGINWTWDPDRLILVPDLVGDIYPPTWVYSTFENVSIIGGEIKGNGTYYGGIGGYADYFQEMTFINCSNSCTIQGLKQNDWGHGGGNPTNYVGYAGGILGFSESANVNLINCYNTALINAWCAGGMIGFIDSYWWTGGGLGGLDWDNGNIPIFFNMFDCYNTGEIIGVCSGGLVGPVDPTVLYIKNSYNTGNVSGCNVGGLVGEPYNIADITIENCYNSGTLFSNNPDNWSNVAVGGLLGYFYGSSRGEMKLTIINSYNIGDIIVDVADLFNMGEGSCVYTGGLIGCADTYTELKLSGSYNIGKMTVNASGLCTVSMGGLFSQRDWEDYGDPSRPAVPAIIKDCFYELEKGVAMAIGNWQPAKTPIIWQGNTTSASSCGKAEGSMQNTAFNTALNSSNTGTQWKQNVKINNGYPYITDIYLVTFKDGASELFETTVNKDKEITYTQIPSRTPTEQYNYTFLGWNTVDTNNTTQEVTIAPGENFPAVTDHVTYYAIFKQSVNSFTISVGKSVNDSADMKKTTYTVGYGDHRTVVFAVASNEVVTRIVVDGTELNRSQINEAIKNGFTFLFVTGNHTVEIYTQVGSFWDNWPWFVSIAALIILAIVIVAINESSRSKRRKLIEKSMY